MASSNPGSSHGRSLPRVALLASQTQPAVTRSRANNRPPTRPPSRTPTVATVEEVPEPVDTPVVQICTPQCERSAPAPTSGDAPDPGESSNICTRQGADDLLNASAVRAICVRNDADLEARLNASIRSLHTQVEGQQNAKDALLGEIKTLRQDVNSLLERLGSVAAVTPPPPPQQHAVTTPEEVAELLDTQALGGEKKSSDPQGIVPVAALAAQPKQAEVSGLSELMDRLSRLEKAQSNDTGNGDSKRFKKGAKSKRRGKSRKARRKRRDDDDDDPSSSSSSSSSSDSDESSDSEDDSRRKRRHRSPVSGAKRFRTRGPRHEDLTPLKATLYAELLNYRHYRLTKRWRRSSRHTAKARHQVKNMGHSMLPHRFSGEDPIMVLDVLRRFVCEAEQLAMSEDQAYIALPFFQKGAAKSHYEAVMDTISEGEGGVTCWPEAVQYLRRSYATANHIREAVLTLRDVRQHPSEDEKTYSARLAKAEVRCGNIHTQDEKKTLFIDGLSPSIKAIVSRHRETHDEETYLELLQHAQAESDTYRARAREGRRPSTTPLVASAKAPKPAPRKASRDDAL